MNSIIVFIRLKKDHGTTLLETSPPKLTNKFIKLLKSFILMLQSFPEFTLGNVWLNLVIPKKEADGSVLNQLENYYSNISHDYYPLIWMTCRCNDTTGYLIVKCEKQFESERQKNASYIFFKRSFKILSPRNFWALQPVSIKYINS